MADCAAAAGSYFGADSACDDNDTDGDGLRDECDQCPYDPNKIVPGICGCGTADTDADVDEIIDCVDECPDTPPDTYVTTYGCATARCDFDRDSDVDQEDFGRFQACLTGHLVPQTDPDCQPALLDGVVGVDQADFTVFAGCMSGANNPADPGCAD